MAEEHPPDWPKIVERHAERVFRIAYRTITTRIEQTTIRFNLQSFRASGPSLESVKPR